jgi:ubiquitin carboxyl-terminal hydrolase 25/28
VELFPPSSFAFAFNLYFPSLPLYILVTHIPYMTADKPGAPRNSVASSYALAFAGVPKSSVQSTPASPGKVKGPRPLSTSSTPDDARTRPGSIHTTYQTRQPSNPPSPIASLHHSQLPTPTSTTQSEVNSALPPYRPPEAVFEPPEEHPVGFVPGVLEEHIEAEDELDAPPTPPPRDGSVSPVDERLKQSAVSGWQAGLGAGEYEEDHGRIHEPDRPVLGAGYTARRWLSDIHPHALFRVNILSLPKSTAKSHNSTSSLSSPVASTSRSHASIASQANSLVDTSASVNQPALPDAPPSSLEPPQTPSSSTPDITVFTLQDVLDVAPGGRNDHQNWYFCPECWGWIRVEAGRGSLPDIPDWDEFADAQKEVGGRDGDDEARLHRWDLDQTRLLKVMSARDTQNSCAIDHLHDFNEVFPYTHNIRIERCATPADYDKFPHKVDSGLADEYATLIHHDDQNTPSTLSVSCNSRLWIHASSRIKPGQIVYRTAKRFLTDREPAIATTVEQSQLNGWMLIMT